MDRRRAAGVLLALAACVAYATAAPTASNHTSLDLYDGAPDGCYYNFQHYGEGDRIMTNEPCLNCTCHNRMLMCYLRVCPFTKPIGQDCTIEKRADQCCPIVTCPDVPVDLLTSTTTSPAEYGATGLGKLDKYGCSIHGKYFPEGSKVPPTPNKPCEHCYCIRNMTTCVMQECTLHVDGCTPIYHKDVCCPVRYSCDHPEDEMPLLDDLSTTVRPTPGFLLTTTTLSPVTQMSQDCLYENKIIPDGALIKTEKACDHCYCMKGDIVCVVQECGTPMENEGKNCTALAPREGVCCPDTYICEGDEPTTGSYEGQDSTTELVQQKLTTIAPPRRVESEGSGYRNEPDDIPITQSPTSITETEGSGDEQATIQPMDVTNVLPDSHKIEQPELISPSEDVTTEKGISESQQYVPSTTSSFISQQSDELLTTISQDEDIGSGEEDFVTPHDIIQPSSDLPVIAESESTVNGDQNVLTTESYKEVHHETHITEFTTSIPTVDQEQSNHPKETGDSALAVTTETLPHLDEESLITEHDTFQATTSVPIIEESDKKTTLSVDKHTTAIPFEVDTRKSFEPIDYSSATTSPPGFEDEIATTESQDVVTDSFEGTDFDLHSHITMTPSTPLLEEIEKENDEEKMPVEVFSNEDKTSTTLSNIPTEEPVEKDSLKPDLIDETIATNIPTSDPAVENDDTTTVEPQIIQATDVEETSEPQQYVPTTSAPAFDDEGRMTTLSDAITSSETHKVDIEESSEPHYYVPTTKAPTFEDKITTPSDTLTSSEPQKTQATDVEDSSEPQQYAPSTSVPSFDDENKNSTPSDTVATSEPQSVQETDVEEKSETQQYASTTIVPEFDDEGKLTTLAGAIASSETQKEQEIDVKDSSEPQQNAPTTSAPSFDEETIKSTASDDIIDPDTQKTQETDVEASSKPQQYDVTTSAPSFDYENKKSTLSDAVATSVPQSVQETDVEETPETQQSASTTSGPAFDDESKITTLSDALTTSEPKKAQESENEETSEPQHYAPTTLIPESDDESKKSTLLDSITTSKPQRLHETGVEESSEPQQYAPTTSAPAFDEEVKETTLSDAITYTETEKVDIHQEASIATTSGHIESTTAEPDKGLNTIPSGSVDEETTESPVVGKYTHPDKIITESATEIATEASIETEPITDKSKPTTTTSDTSASREDQTYLTTESTVKENVEGVASTETADLAKQTTVKADISEESITTLAHEYPSSTKSPTSDYQDTSTSLEQMGTESFDQTTGSATITTQTYPSSTQATETEDSTSEKHETMTSSPSYNELPESTTANLQDNEIINEPRIPGEGDCLLNGVTYRNESTVPSTNKCQSGCRCSSSIIKCDPIICSPPPEYMDNCQPTYDSQDSCCPTYVCDHKTETMPPQSHSQMSGTEAPVVSPVKCNGDECILNVDKNQSEETPALCTSSSCTGQDETSLHPPYIPKQPVDLREGCTGDKCKSSDSSDQLCSEGKDCQALPVTPCEGNECENSSDNVQPLQKQPCVDGEDCDVPDKDCSGDKCSIDADMSEKKPHEKTCENGEDCKDILDIEKECTDKSCKRKDDAALGQQPPKKCSGSECQSTELISDEELTTEAGSLTSLQKEMELEVQNTYPDKLETITEKIETTSELPVIDLDRTTRPIEDKTEEPVEKETTQSDHISKTEPHLTTGLPDTTTLIPDMIDMSPISESVTSSKKQDVTESPVSLASGSTNIYDEVNTESQTNPTIHVTEEQDNLITETSDSSDIPYDKTTEISEEIQTVPPKTHLVEQEVTKLPIDIDKQETTTIVTEKTEPTKIDVTEPQDNKDIIDRTTNIPEIIFTEPPKTDYTELSFKPTGMEELSTKIADAFTVSSETSSIEPQKVTSAPVDNQHDEMTTRTYVLESQEVTKSPQESEDDLDTINIVEDDGSTPSKTYESDNQETTEGSGQTHSEETTDKQTVEISIKPEDHLIPDMQEATKPPESDKEEITTHSLDLTTESFDLEDKEVTYLHEVKETTQSPKEIDNKELFTKKDDEMITKTSEPYDTEKQEVTPSLEEFERVGTTIKSDATESSIFITKDEQKTTESPNIVEATPIKDTDNTVIEQPKQDETAHDITVTQQENEIEVTTSNIKEEIGTELSKPDESEPSDTTKSPVTFNIEQTMATVIKETDIEPTKPDDLEPHSVTQPESMPSSDMTIESHSLESSTTSQPETLPESTTPTILITDSKITEPEKITTGIQEQLTELATESLDKVTTASSKAPIHKESEVTSMSDQDITTESPLYLTTKVEPHPEEITPSDKPSEVETVLPEIEINTSDKTVTKLTTEQDTKEEDRATTESSVDLAEISEKPVLTNSDDNKTQEDTAVPTLHETEKDSSEATTLQPIYATENTYETDLKTEQPETAHSPKEDKSTESSIATKSTTQQIMEDLTTELPVSLEIVSEGITEKPIIREPLATEPSKLDTTEKDELKTEAPVVNELITLIPEEEEKLTEKPTELVQETDTSQQTDKDTIPTESEVEAYTKTPLLSTSEVAEIEASLKPDQEVEEKLTAPSESTGSPELNTEIPIEVTQKEEETSTKKEDDIHESSTKDQFPTDMHQLSSESPKESYTEVLEETATTEGHMITEPEKIYEPVTETEEQIIKDIEIKTSEPALFESTPPTATESADQITKLQENIQDDKEDVDVATDEIVTKGSDETPSVPKTTVAPEAFEMTTVKISEITSEPEIEKSPHSEHKTTLEQGVPETTTSSINKDEAVSVKETTELPAASSDEQTVEIVTESQSSNDLTTAKQETTSESVEQDLPSRTEYPELYPTTSSTGDASEKSTPSPVVEEATTVPDQTMTTSIEPHVSEGEQATTVVSDITKASTPSIEDIEVPTETVVAEKPLPPQPSSETETEKLTTSKAEEITSASPVIEKFTTPAYKPTEATEQPRPIPTEEQPTDDLTPDEEPSIPPSGTSGYGTDPDYMEEDQTFGPGTCRYGGKVYVSAQQIPRDDPCDFCFCFRSDIICLQQSCPPPIHGCHEEPISGFCCPRYECPVSMATTVNVTTTTTTTTTTLPPHFPVHSYKGSAQKRGCLIKGHTYKVGEVVRASSGPCLHCTCGGDGQMKCDPKQCTPEPMLRQMIAAAVSAKRRR